MKRLAVLFYSFVALLNACTNSSEFDETINDISESLLESSYLYYATGTEWLENSKDIEFESVDVYETKEYTVEKFENKEKDVTVFGVTLLAEDMSGAFFGYYTETHSGIPECDSLVYIKDVNFDNKDDVCISIGTQSSTHDDMFYIAYLSNYDGTYTFCDGFENVANPVIDEENKCILSHTVDGTSTVYCKYVYEENKIIETEHIERCGSENSLYHNGTFYSIDAGTEGYDIYLSPNGEWDLDSEKWHNTIVN